jgi:hypothetical protein
MSLPFCISSRTHWKVMGKASKCFSCTCPAKAGLPGERFALLDLCGGGFCFGQKALSNKPFRLKYLGIEGPTECRLESETHDFERRLSAGPKTRQLDWKPLATACPVCSAV